MSTRIYTTSDYRYLRDELLDRANGTWPHASTDTKHLIKGKVERDVFPDGEVYKRITDKIAGDHCIILSGLNSDNNFMEVCELAQFLVEHDAQKLTMIVPYFGYSTMERATKDGEFVKAKYRADMLSRLPRASYGNRIVLMDLHAEQIIHYFHDLTAYHIDNRNIVIQAAKDMVGAGNPFVIAATDVGRAKHVEYLARLSGMEPAYVYKRRDSGTKTEVTGANCDVKDKDVVIFDDMIRSGNTILKAAKVYRSLGATRVFVIISHVPMISGLVMLANSSEIDHISIMNTHPSANTSMETQTRKISLYSVVGNIIDWLKY